MIYPPSDFVAVIIPAEGGRGCGAEHRRPDGPDGRPVQPWALSCAGGCEAWLLAHDSRWVQQPEDIRETFDEIKARERFELRGTKDRDALVALALARMAGVSQAEIPSSIAKALSGLPAHVPGVVVCGSGHDNRPGSRFCSACGEQLGRPAAAAAIGA